MKKKISFLILFITLQQYSLAGLKDIFKKREKMTDLSQVIHKKVDRGEQMEMAKDYSYDVFKDEMAKSIQALDAEMFKKNTLKSLHGRNPNDPNIKFLKVMNAEEFKSKMIRGQDNFDADRFILAVSEERKKYGMESLTDGRFKPNDEEEPEEPKQLPVPNYGFEPKVKIDLKQVKSKLNDDQFLITQYSSIEYPGSGIYIKHFEQGKYNCIVCDKNLFTSADKYKSKKGYAAFNSAIGDIFEIDLDGTNTSAKCENCGSNIGDVVRDDPGSVTGKTYLVNSNSIIFESGYEFIP